MFDPDVHSDPVRVVIAGGGVAALEALVALSALSRRRLQTTLIAPREEFAYRPLQVGEPFGLGHGRRYALAALCRERGAEFVRDRVIHVDTGERSIALGGGGRIAYDILILAVGANAYPAFEHGATFDRERAPADFDEVLSATGGGLAPRLAIVVPKGASWTLPAYELAMLTTGYFPSSHVTLVTYEQRPLEAFGVIASSGVAEILATAGVALRCAVEADVATATALRLGWEWFEVERIVSLPLLSGPRIAGLPADEHGFIPVDDHARVSGIDDVYAAGDGTTLPIKQGGLATQQADAAVLHIASRLGGAMNPTALAPVLRGLLITPDGPRFLRAELADPERTSAISAEPLWWPPSKIASRWLAPHLAQVDARNAAGLVPADA